MMTEEVHRYRVSTNFTLIKVLLVIGILSTSVSFWRSHNITFSSETVLPLIILVILIVVFGLIHLKTQTRVEYNDVLQCLYIVNLTSHNEERIPIENIKKIHAVKNPGNLIAYYKIDYISVYGENQKLVLWTIPYDDSIETIVRDAKHRNPELIENLYQTTF